MTHEEAMLSVLNGARNGISAREFIARTMRLMNESGDPDDMARKCGFEPDDLIRPGKNFMTIFKVIHGNRS